MSLQNAVRVSDLIDTMGVATHISYTDGQYRDIKADLAALKYLGINHVRDGAPNPAYDPFGQGHFGDAAAAGVKFTFVAQGNVDPGLVVARLHAFAAAHPNAIVGIEGPNEVNNWPVTYHGLTGTAGAQAYQQALYTAVKADSLLKGIPVLGFTDYPVHAAASDWNTIHPYPKNGNQPYETVAAEAKAQAAVDPGKPFAITEGGYHTSLSADTKGGWEGVDEATQAKMTLNMYLDAAQQGSKSTNLYQLLDAYPDRQGGGDQEVHFGMFRLDGSAKPAATAIHNLTTILRDPGANAGGFQAGGLDYSASGLPVTGHTYLTAKSDGSYQIIAWNEPDIWDQVADRAIAVAPTSVAVNLGKVYATVEVFDPLQGTQAVQTLHNVSSVAVGLGDHPLVIQVSGAVAAQPVQVPPVQEPPVQEPPVQVPPVQVPPVQVPPVASPPVASPPVASPPVTSAPANPGGTPDPVATPGTTTIGSGPDTLVLKISEDAYKGHAQYTIAVDGKAIGGTLTAQAAHAAKQFDTVTVRGDWAVGDHTVSVGFVNNAFGGTAAADRNLYVEGATYNGAAVSGAKLWLLTNGTATFAVHDVAPVPPAATPVATTIGSGPDTLVLKISEDAYKGDAQYTIAVDGKQIGGTLTAQAAHAAKQSDTITVKGDWAAGDHTVSVAFLNDAYGGTAGTDRNLYVEGATYNGAAVSGAKFSLTSAGARTIAVHEAAPVTAAPAASAPAATPVATTIGSGPDTLVLKISEDAYKGDAQYTIAVDGKQIGGTLTAQAAHAAKQSDTITVKGDWAKGDHTVSLHFLNDAFDGTRGTDRNLYLDGATYNDAAVSGAKLSLTGTAPQAFSLHDFGFL